jgi:hypothetical protein
MAKKGNTTPNSTPSTPAANAPISTPPTAPIKKGPAYRIATRLQKQGIPAYEDGGAAMAKAAWLTRNITAQQAQALVKHPIYDQATKLNGISHSWLLASIGQDRGLMPYPPAPKGWPAPNNGSSSYFTEYRINGTGVRYISPQALTLGIVQLQILQAAGVAACANPDATVYPPNPPADLLTAGTAVLT